MAYLFYVELGGQAAYDLDGNPQHGISLVTTAPFTNLLLTSYWSVTEPDIGIDAFRFSFAVDTRTPMFWMPPTTH